MADYRKKPVVIQATQWFKQGDHQSVSKLRGTSPKNDIRCHKCGDASGKHGAIATLETREGGEHVVCPGDWIITGVQGEHYACKPDIFEQTYDPAQPPTDQPAAGVEQSLEQPHADTFVESTTGTSVPHSVPCAAQETPRTDAVELHWREVVDDGKGSGYLVPAAFAQQLERELSALRSTESEAKADEKEGVDVPAFNRSTLIKGKSTHPANSNKEEKGK